MVPYLIVGIGSPNGDDAAGWHVVEGLTHRVRKAARTLVLGDPSQILSHLDGCQWLGIVDACRSGLPPGSVLRMTWPDERLDTCTAGSTHALSLNNILQLAQTLGRLPGEVVIYAVETGTATAPETEMSPEVASALPEIERMLLQDLPESQGIDALPPD